MQAALGSLMTLQPFPDSGDDYPSSWGAWMCSGCSPWSPQSPGCVRGQTDTAPSGSLPGASCPPAQIHWGFFFGEEKLCRASLVERKEMGEAPELFLGWAGVWDLLCCVWWDQEGLGSSGAAPLGMGRAEGSKASLESQIRSSLGVLGWGLTLPKVTPEAGPDVEPPGSPFLPDVKSPEIRA